jgi:hypothetical protein
MKIPSSAVEHVTLANPPWEISTGDESTTPMEALGGSFAFQTDLKGRYVTAVDGGGRTTDVIHTNVGGPPRASETFRIWVDIATHQYYAFETANGHFVTANNGGGLIENAIHTSATSINGWGMFRVLPTGRFLPHAIQTLRGFFLTAVGGGGHDSGETIHTDSVVADEWERFNIFRAADFGTGSTYAIQAWGGNVINPWLTAPSGGRQPGPNALTTGGGPPFWISWTLLKQADGTYAFQTASGGILTANGGGLASEGFRTDTELDMIGNWEKFTLEDNGDFTAYIKTHAGTYVSYADTNRATTVLNREQATRWRFFVVGF